MKSRIPVLFLLLLLCQGILGQDIQLSLVQYPIEGDRSLSQVLTKMQQYVQQSKQANASIVLFPELTILDMYPLHTKKQGTQVIREIAQSTKAFRDAVSEWAKTYQILIVAGSTPRVVTDGSIRNSALIAFPDGKTHWQDKLHLTSWEKKVKLSPGGSLTVFKTPWGSFSVFICYDIEVPKLSSLLSHTLPELILVPSMTEDEFSRMRVRWSAQSRAVEQIAYVAVTGTVGSPEKDFTNLSEAALISPQLPGFAGEPVVAKKNQPGITVVKLDFQKIKEARLSPEVFPVRDGVKSDAKVIVENKP